MTLQYEGLSESGLEPVVICTDNNDGTFTGAGADTPLNVAAGKGIPLDAWGRQKVIHDISLISGMFTNSIVPSSVFKETFNGVEQTAFVNAISESGRLSLVAGATLNDVTVLDTFEAPRYEPNRGHIYSASIFLPLPTAAGVRDFGMFTEENGAFFRLKSDGVLYACRRTTFNGAGTTTVEEAIDLTPLGETFDVALGNIYDIQMQWRGVGNIKFFIGNPARGVSVLVHTMNLLGTLTGLSIANPALPIAYRCENLGANVEINSGCADISSEGGTDKNHVYGAISLDNESGEVAILGFNIPILVVRNKSTFNGLRNMRGMQAFAAYAYADQRAFMRVWFTRDPTAITLNDQAWVDYGDGNIEYLQYDNPDVTTPMTFDTAKATLVFGARVDADSTFVTSALYEGQAEIQQTPGDILIFTVHRDNGLGTSAGATYEFGIEV